MRYYNFSLLLLLLVIFSFTSTAQTQLLKPGNAACYMLEPPGDILNLTLGTENINGTEYYKIKNFYMPWYTANSGGTSYQRISGDSCYYIWNSKKGTDSLVFNFTWPVGKVIRSDTSTNSVYEQRIDSILIEENFVQEDTVYYLTGYVFNLTTLDTFFINIPEYTRYSKKFGLMDYGISGGMIGVKIDGVRYGIVHPYPEEVEFSADTLVSNTGNDIAFSLVNTSNYEVTIDTAVNFSIEKLFYYHFTLKIGNDSIQFGLNDRYPGIAGDTINLSVQKNDSVLITINDIEGPNTLIDNSIGFIMHFNGPGSENSYTFSKAVAITGHATILFDISEDGLLPEDITLYQNYPNPFNPVTTIKYSINRSGMVHLSVFDLLGREVITLVNEYQSEGLHETQLNTGSLSSSVYFYRLQFLDKSLTKKLTILK